MLPKSSTVLSFVVSFGSNPSVYPYEPRLQWSLKGDVVCVTHNALLRCYNFCSYSSHRNTWADHYDVIAVYFNRSSRCLPNLILACYSLKSRRYSVCGTDPYYGAIILSDFPNVRLCGSRIKRILLQFTVFQTILIKQICHMKMDNKKALTLSRRCS